MTSKLFVGWVSTLVLIWMYFWQHKYHLNIVIGVLVHNEATFRGFLDILEMYPQPEYIVHIDEKYKIPSVHLPHNVRILDKRLNIKWGRFSLVHAELLLLNYTKQYDYDYFVLLDGTTMPIVPYRQFQEDLKKLEGKSIVFQHKPYETCKKGNSMCVRTKAKCFDDACTKYDITPNNKPVYKAAQWVLLGKEFIDYYHQNHQWALQWIKFFRNTRMPDESFFQTLLMDSPFNVDVVKRYVVYTKWRYCFQPPKRRGASPCWLVKQDFADVVTSDSWFARKIHINSNLRPLIKDYVHHVKINS